MTAKGPTSTLVVSPMSSELLGAGSPFAEVASCSLSEYGDVTGWVTGVSPSTNWTMNNEIGSL